MSGPNQFLKEELCKGKERTPFAVPLLTSSFVVWLFGSQAGVTK